MLSFRKKVTTLQGSWKNAIGNVLGFDLLSFINLSLFLFLWNITSVYCCYSCFIQMSSTCISSFLCYSCFIQMSSIVGSSDALLAKAKNFIKFIDDNQINSAVELTVTSTELAELFHGLRDLYYLFSVAAGNKLIFLL